MPLFGTRGAASVTGFGGLAKLGYLLRNSLRFRASNSNYLNRTFGTPTDAKKWTLSLWLKRGLIGSSSYQIMSAGSAVSDQFHISSDSLSLYLGGAYRLVTTQVLRDPAAWYHIVLVIDTANATADNRNILYINGVQVTSFSTRSNLGPNATTNLNAASTVTYIGRYAASSSEYIDGYLTEVNFIDGQALTPSSFGKTDAVTGQWIPIKYGSTYGTNGFYLPFTNTTSTSTLGNDFSGNSNTWTVNNFSLTAGITYDSMTDVPTLTSATAANYATINPLDYNLTYLTLNEANLHQTYAGVSAAAASRATMAIPTTGKFYWEIYINATGGGSGERVRVGICRQSTEISGNSIDGSATAYGIISDGKKRNNSTDTNYGAGFSAGQYIQVLYDATAGAIYFGQNNSFANGSGSFNQAFATATAAFTSLSGEFIPFFITYGGADIYVNFGQRPFAYTPPSGYVALNSFNLA